MTNYMLLPHPGVSAVFFDASEGLSLAETALCLSRLETACKDARPQSLAGMRWISFDAEAQLSPGDLARLSRLSCLYALFERHGESLRPVETQKNAPFGEDLSAILKYAGKTNALFTRLMLHIAELSLDKPPLDRPIRLLDPVAGKGTTLFEALMRGFEASGIEIVQRAAHEGAVYFQKYLETEKWKHKLQKEKSYGAPTWRFTFARDKESLKENPGRLTMVAGDAGQADRFFGRHAFDIIAGDLPYGVAHGNIAGGGLVRSPKALLQASLRAWHAALRPGGVLALSWNTLVYPTEDMIALLGEKGFDCLRGAPYDSLAHRVDASIRRDVVVCVKKT